MSRPLPPRRLFYRLSHGIRITVRPEYLAGQSDPTGRRFVFAYYVRIEDIEVEGVGVVGEQPVIAPGMVHEYQSFCILKSSSGYMEGAYRFVRDDGGTFDAEIPRFQLAGAELGMG